MKLVVIALPRSARVGHELPVKSLPRKRSHVMHSGSQTTFYANRNLTGGFCA